jgi:hypothetical protein
MNRPLTVIDTNVVWALLAAHKGSMLVTGDRLLLDNPPDFASVISPRSFVALLDNPEKRS